MLVGCVCVVTVWPPEVVVVWLVTTTGVVTTALAGGGGGAETTWESGSDAHPARSAKPPHMMTAHVRGDARFARRLAIENIEFIRE